MVREGPAQPPPYPAEKARHDIVVHAWLRRVLVAGGLIAIVAAGWLLMAMR
jgi:hypothetical protein